MHTEVSATDAPSNRDLHNRRAPALRPAIVSPSVQSSHSPPAKVIAFSSRRDDGFLRDLNREDPPSLQPVHCGHVRPSSFEEALD